MVTQNSTEEDATDLAPTMYDCLRDRHVPTQYHEAALAAAHDWIASFRGLDKETPYTLANRLAGRAPGGKW